MNAISYYHIIKRSKIVFFSTGGMFSLRARQADLDAARLGRRSIARGPAARESRPRLGPVVCAARSQSSLNRVSFEGDPSRSAMPSKLRETRSAIRSFTKKRVSQSHTVSFEKDLPPEVVIETFKPRNA